MMEIEYKSAQNIDVEPIYNLSKKLIDDYENIESINYEKVLAWVKKKISDNINDYKQIYYRGNKVGYIHFYKNDEERYEIDDLFIFEPFQNKHIGTQVILDCCQSCGSEVMLFVFVKNERAVRLYERLGFKIEKSVNNSRYIMVRQP